MCSSQLSARLSDAVQQSGEPRCADVERLAASDSLELNGPQLVAAFLVLPDYPRLTAQRRFDRQVGHGLDQLKVTLIRCR